MAKKKTNREKFQEILDLCVTDEQRDFILKEIEKLDKRSERKTETENQKRNKVIAQAVLDYLTENVGTAFTVTELMQNVDAFQTVSPLSNQYASAVVRSLVTDGKVTRIMEKGRAKFAVAGE